MKANQAFPPYRTEMLGELSIPHVRPHFDIGDVVWAQARGLPSWPGQIVDESKVGKGRADEGKVRKHNPCIQHEGFAVLMIF